MTPVSPTILTGPALDCNERIGYHSYITKFTFDPQTPVLEVSEFLAQAAKNMRASGMWTWVYGPKPCLDDKCSFTIIHGYDSGG